MEIEFADGKDEPQHANGIYYLSLCFIQFLQFKFTSIIFYFHWCRVLR